MVLSVKMTMIGDRVIERKRRVIANFFQNRKSPNAGNWEHLEKSSTYCT